MQMTSIRKFRSDVSKLTKKGEVIIITSHGKMVGCFLPFQHTDEIPIEFKKEFSGYLGKQIGSHLSSLKVAEEEVIDDFKKFKKTRRRQ